MNMIDWAASILSIMTILSNFEFSRFHEIEFKNARLTLLVNY